MSEPFIGEIKIFGFNFPPRGWAQCNGQLLPINQNSALFSLLGTIYGGDGETSFGLPELRGRFPMHYGSGPGLTTRPIGQKDGSQTETLTANQIPAHTHTGTVKASTSVGNSASPATAIPSVSNDGESNYTTAGSDTTMATGSLTVDSTGGDQAHNNLPPYLALNFCIALIGVFPSQ